MLRGYHGYATSKDRMRMSRLILYTQEKGLTAGMLKAERDAEKIESWEKLENRARILEQEGYSALAKPFRARQQWLQAQGVF